MVMKPRLFNGVFFYFFYYLFLRGIIILASVPKNIILILSHPQNSRLGLLILVAVSIAHRWVTKILLFHCISSPIRYPDHIYFLVEKHRKHAEFALVLFCATKSGWSGIIHKSPWGAFHEFWWACNFVDAGVPMATNLLQWYELCSQTLHYSDVIMSALAYQITSLFNRLFKAQIKENIKAPRHWPLFGEFTGHRWIPRTNDQWWRHHEDEVCCFHPRK